MREFGSGRGPRGFGAAGSEDLPKRTLEQDRQTLGRVVAIFTPYWKHVALVVLAIVAASLVGLVNPLLLKLIIDDALPTRDMRMLNVDAGFMILAPIVGGIIGVG